MHTHLRNRDLISTQDWSVEDLMTVLDVAKNLKMRRALGEPHALLRDKVLAMLFFFSSTRTRASFEAGMTQLGGHGMFMESKTTQISHGDTPKEIGEILGRYNDGIAIRHCDWNVGNRYIRAVAEASRSPVFNMECDTYHPFQVLADLMTIFEKKGDPRGLTIDVSWAYASSYQKPMAVPQSLVLLMTRMGMNVRLTRPPEFKLRDEVMAQAEENAKRSGGSLEVSEHFADGFKGADIVYPKSWGCMMTTEDTEEAKKLAKRYERWICDVHHMELAKPDANYMHCLPADRDIEVANKVIDGPQSVVYDEAENRLHVQKAVLALSM
jgi:N-acetylornithine carbamoyltransferase